jgi:SAM-dependent methyltransferase
VEPKSVIDVGCGTGVWLSVFKEYGIEDIWGVDGEYVAKETLEIPEERFIPSDLGRPFHSKRKFDLVVSLEVAEHLPRQSAETFVGSLTGLGPVVLFSAAIPYQGGSQHLNEQWQGYWADLFRERGYVGIDCLRRRIWSNEEVEFWYCQNTIVFAAQGQLENHPLLKKEHELSYTLPLSMVHPRLYLAQNEKTSLRQRLLGDLKRTVPAGAKKIVRTAMAEGYRRTLRR